MHKMCVVSAIEDSLSSSRAAVMLVDVRAGDGQANGDGDAHYHHANQRANVDDNVRYHAPCNAVAKQNTKKEVLYSAEGFLVNTTKPHQTKLAKKGWWKAIKKEGSLAFFNALARTPVKLSPPLLKSIFAHTPIIIQLSTCYACMDAHMDGSVETNLVEKTILTMQTIMYARARMATIPKPAAMKSHPPELLY